MGRAKRAANRAPRRMQEAEVDLNLWKQRLGRVPEWVLEGTELAACVEKRKTPLADARGSVDSTGYGGANARDPV
ncbi:MAG: hypothetical protein U0R19_30760 [Bryobacteraceae bacterium]